MKRSSWLIVFGVGLRIAVAALTLHGDETFIFERPARFFENLPTIDTYYPPLAYVLFGFLSPIFFLSQFTGRWIVKMVFLIPDFLTLLGLRRLVHPSFHRRLDALWLLNPVTLYATYAQGQYDVVVASLLVWSLVVLEKGRKGISVSLWSVAIALKTYPVFVLPILAVMMSKWWMERMKYFFLGLVVPIAVGVLFWMISGTSVVTSYFPSVAHTSVECSLRPDAVVACANAILGILLYIAVLILSIRTPHTILPASTMFIGFSALFIANRAFLFQHFVALVPFLLLVTIERAYSRVIVWGWSLALILGYLYTWPLQWGMVAHWFPVASERLALREVVAPFVNYETIAFVMRVVARLVLVVTTLALLRKTLVSPDQPRRR